MKKKREKMKLSEILNSKSVIGALIFIMLSLTTVLAGNVIVKEGSIDIENNLNASNILFVNGSSGLVGIGTTTPQNFLNVVGDLNVTGNSILNLNWTFLQNYPVACPAGTFATQIDDSITCTAPVADDVDPGNFPVGDYSFDTNLLFIDSTNNRVAIGTNKSTNQISRTP